MFRKMLFILKTYFHYFLSSYFTIVKEHFMFENADEIKDNIFIFVYLYAFLRNLLQKCEQKNSLINKSKKITYNLLSLILNDMIIFSQYFPQQPSYQNLFIMSKLLVQFFIYIWTLIRGLSQLCHKICKTVYASRSVTCINIRLTDQFMGI